jgi:hypothetical protein
MIDRRTLPLSKRFLRDVDSIGGSHALLSIGATVALIAAAALPTSANAQHQGGRGGGGGAVQMGAGGGGGGGMAAARGSGGASFSAARGSGGSFAAQRSGSSNVAVRSGGSSERFATRSGGDRFAAGSSNWKGGHKQGRHHRFRPGAGVAFDFAGPAYYDYATPYYDEEEGCYQIRHVHTQWGWVDRRVWVCD